VDPADPEGFYRLNPGLGLAKACRVLERLTLRADFLKMRGGEVIAALPRFGDSAPKSFASRWIS